MYLASFESATGLLCQGCVRLPTLPPVGKETCADWWAEFARLVASAGALTDGALALRVRLAENCLLERVLFVATPARHEWALRRFLASFTRLDNLIEGSVELPLDRTRYDQLAAQMPRWRTRVAPPCLAIGDVWFASDFRVAPHLDALLAEADTFGHQFGYQVHLHALAPDPERVRAARKNALRARNLAGVPDALVRTQQRLADALDTAAVVYEEFLAVDTPAAAAWLADAVRRHAQGPLAALKLEPPETEFVAGDYDELLTVALHSGTFIELAPDEICASALDERGRAALLGWRPSNDLARRFASRVAPPARAADNEAVDDMVAPLPPDLKLPVPYDGAEPFIFISYKRQDIARIAPIMESLIAAGCHLWYDRGIPGGAEWDALLEQKLKRCQLVLLFVSQSAIQSKYVRREVKFADALDKPILSVKLEEAQLTHGMNMLLTQYQMLDRALADFHEQLQKAIRYITNLTIA